MRKQKFICALSALFIVISCSGDNTSGGDLISEESKAVLTEQEAKVLFRMREPDNRVSMDEVTKLANDAISMLDGEALVKSGSARRINSISALVADSKPALKSGDLGDIEVPDTLAYILNFNDSLGFAIISADTRIDTPLLAFTENGTLIDSTDNPGIAIFLERLEDYMLNSIAEAEEQKDSLLAGIMGKLGTEASTKATDNMVSLSATTKSSLDTVSMIPPLIPVQWGQGTPFNDSLGGRCVDDKGNVDEYLAGCVAVAVGQIMAYWKYPEISDKANFWLFVRKYKTKAEMDNATNSDINSSTYKKGMYVKTGVAKLMKDIGKGVGMDYGCKSSGTSTSSSINYLSKLGFKTDGKKGYDLDTVVSSLNAGRPLMATGCSEKIRQQFLGITYNTYHDGCHQWIIDGHLKRRTTLLDIDGSKYFIYINYLHNNWGWYGGDNGYFVSGVFNSNLEPLPYTKANEDYNYQYRIEIIPNIYKFQAYTDR